MDRYGSTSEYRELLEILKWSNPIINPNCGKAEPPDRFKRDGFMVYADGINWDPGSGKGLYRWDGTTNAWVLLGGDGGGGGASSFIELTDTPDTYEGQAGKIIKVNSEENALEYGISNSGESFQLKRTAIHLYRSDGWEKGINALGDDPEDDIQEPNEIGIVYEHIEFPTGGTEFDTYKLPLGKYFFNGMVYIGQGYNGYGYYGNLAMVSVNLAEELWFGEPIMGLNIEYRTNGISLMKGFNFVFEVTEEDSNWNRFTFCFYLESSSGNLIRTPSGDLRIVLNIFKFG